MESEDKSKPLEEIEIHPDEYEECLWEAYKKADFEKPRNFIGLVKKLSVEKMEKALRNHLAVSEEDLRILAQERAKSIRGYLLRSGKVETGRIFLKGPESISPEPIEGYKESRVEVKLK